MSVAVETTDSYQLSSAGKLLFQAAKEGNVESLKTLLELPGASDACAFVSSENDHTALSIAAVNKHLKCVEALIPLISPSELAKQLTKAESHAKDRHILQALKVYKEDVHRFGTTRLHMEKEVSAIAEHTTCTVGELQRFSILVDHLITECSYVLDGEENTTPLLIK
eukprot:Em0020g1005a